MRPSNSDYRTKKEISACSWARCWAAACCISVISSCEWFLATRRFFSTGVKPSRKLSLRITGVVGVNVGCWGWKGVRNGSLGVLRTRAGVPAFSSLCKRLRGVDSIVDSKRRVHGTTRVDGKFPFLLDIRGLKSSCINYGKVLPVSLVL